MPGRTDCTSGNLRINREVSAALSSNVGRDVSAVRACNNRGKYCACVTLKRRIIGYLYIYIYMV